MDSIEVSWDAMCGFFIQFRMVYPYVVRSVRGITIFKGSLMCVFLILQKCKSSLILLNLFFPCFLETLLD